MDVTTIITQIFLPISLAIIMFGMGLTLVVSDFSRLFTYPKEVLIGLFNQLIFLPLIGFLIILITVIGVGIVGTITIDLGIIDLIIGVIVGTTDLGTIQVIM